MIRVGLTGGIATGKSTVAKLLRAAQYPVIDADQVARDIVRPGTPTLLEIQHRFGSSILTSNGELDRDALRQIILSNPEAKRDLEALTHPLIRSTISHWLEQQSQKEQIAAFVEAALLIETGSHESYDLLVVVTCSPQQQLSRLLARNPISEQEALGWISKQLPLEHKEQIADFVIRNEGSMLDVELEVQRLLQLLPSHLQSHAH